MLLQMHALWLLGALMMAFGTGLLVGVAVTYRALVRRG